MNYSTVAGTATGGGVHPDFVPASGQLVIPPGEISTNISVSLLQDDLIETREEFTVVLQKANEALFQFGDSVGRIHIKNGLYNTPPGGDIITIAPETGNAAETGLTDGILIRATPNPSSNFFTLNIGGKATDHVSVIVTNVAGQIMNKFDGALKNSQLVFGQNYRSGSYFVRVVDGKETKVIKLIKTSK